MNIELHIEQIEEFMGHEYGEVPRIVNKEEFYSLAYDYELARREDTPEVRKWLSEKFGSEWDSLKQTTSALYNSAEHVIVSMRGKMSDLTLTHELSHAYLRNQWPGYYKMWASAQRNGMCDFETMQNYFVKNALIEGHADTIALAISPDREGGVRLELFSSPHIRRKEFLAKTFAYSLSEENSFEERDMNFQISSRSIGYNVVNKALKNTDNRHKTFKKLLLARFTPEQLHNKLFD